MMEAQAYRELDEMHKMHQLAYATVVAGGRKSAGKGKEKPVYKTFKTFFDAEKEERKLDRRLGLAKTTVKKTHSKELTRLLKAEQEERMKGG